MTAGKKVLVVDAGGRGNALAHAFARSQKVSEVHVAPGNAGSSLLEKCQQVPLKSISEMIEYAKKYEIDLTFVGPEGYLSQGIVNDFQKAGLRIVGPTKEATVLESSKCDTKDFLKKIGVPIAPYRNFDSADEAKEYAKEFYESNPDQNLVVKADGLAAGKGSIVCNSLEEALYAIDKIMVEKIFGDAGNRVDIEKRLYGKELMFFALTDGKTILPMEAAMDYKLAFDEDDCGRIEGYNGIVGNPNRKHNPNTGGMGGYSPHPWLDKHLVDKIMERIAKPVVNRLGEYESRKFGRLNNVVYQGIIYFGLMVCEEDGERNPYVLEINVRMGDPEAQVILPRLKTDFYDVSEAMIGGTLDKITLEWDPMYCLGICAVSGASRGTDGLKEGYPGRHYTNRKIYGLRDVDKSCLVFHNGTAFRDRGRGDEDGNILTTGGRVLTLVAKGKSLQEAREVAYREIKKIRFNGMRYRMGIGLK
jgi:phosphoribosylamine--glycine ligase